MQLEGKKCHNKKLDIEHKELIPRDIVLFHNTRKEKDISCKLAFKWLGLYMISDKVKDKRTYMLEKLDGLQLASTFMNN